MFSKLSAPTQHHLLRMVRMPFLQHRKHRGDPLAFTVSYAELERDFGRGGFDRINKELGLFLVDEHYFSGKGQTVSTRRETKRYYLHAEAERIYLEELSRKPRRHLLPLVDVNGKQVKTPPRGVDSLDNEKRKARFWIDEQVPIQVPVNIAELDKLVEQLPKPDLYKPEDKEREELRIRYALEVRKMATTALSGRGYMAHRYQESSTGRLTAQGQSNLQGAPRTVRTAALVGHWDYDFENCHYCIVEQMAGEYGLDCPAIRYYLDHKAEVRQELMRDIGLTEKQAKQALIAIIYGARLQENRFVALYEAVGRDQAKQEALIRHPRFKALHKAVNAATGHILSHWPVTRGKLVNEAGKAISTAAGKDKRMAHLVQGAEAVILRAAFRLCRDQGVVLLVHDGLVSTQRLKPTAIEDEVRRATGYRMVLVEERIQHKPDLGLG